MARIIDESTQVDQTIRIFDNFYKVKLNVPTNEYDIVRGYFLSVNKSARIANNFTAFFFRICQETNIEPQLLLKELKGIDNTLKVNQVMAYYINSLKSPYSLYGVNKVLRPNLPIARNIVQ